MTKELLKMLKCPICASYEFSLYSTTENQREIRKGKIQCQNLHTFLIKDGIVNFLIQPNKTIELERGGLKKLAQKMINDGFKKNDLFNLLRDNKDPYWKNIRLNFNQILNLNLFEKGNVILDIGANNCWASNEFSHLGLKTIALDISSIMFQGLKSSDVFIERGVYFERVLGTMYNLPFNNQVFDYIFCSATLHHNNLQELQKTLQEISRVLKEDGAFIILNEPTKGLLDKKNNFASDVEEYKGNENIYSIWKYKSYLKRAGFKQIYLMSPDSLYLKTESKEYRKYAQKNIFLFFLYNIFLLFYRKNALKKIIRKITYKPITYLFGGVAFIAIVKK